MRPMRAAGWILPLLLLASTISASAQSRTGRVALAARLSTLGAGVEAVTPLFERVNFRAGAHAGGLDYSDTQGDVDYRAEARLRTAGALLDWHPAGGGFRLSAGALYNGSDLRGTGRPRQTTRIGDTRYGAEELGTLSARVTFPRLAGYAGIGFGNAVAADHRWTALFDLGLLFFDNPELALRADGALSNNAAFQAELEKERRSIQDDYVRYARYYPVLSLGLAFRF